MAVSQIDCLKTPPPEPPELIREDCEYAICLDDEAAKKLALWAAEIDRWADEAWQKCSDQGDN